MAAGSDTATPTTVRRYGNFRRPTSPGLGSLGFGGTVLLFIGLIGLIVCVAMQQIVLGLLWALSLSVVLGLLMWRDQHHRTAFQRLGTRFAWWRTRQERGHLYRSGATGRVPSGKFQLPGLLASTRLHEYADSYDRRFAMIETPSIGHYSVVIACAPDGASLVDQEQIDQWVASWGQWIAGLSQEANLVGAAVTVETAPDTGARLRREVEGRMAPDAPDLARQMLTEVMHTYPVGSASVRAWVTLTFNGRGLTNKKRAVDDIARDIATRLPGLTQGLAATGAGPAAPVSALGVCEIVRVAYDPAAAPLLDEIHAQGHDPDLAWEDVGPVATEASWDAYRHDSAVSRTWMMTSAPRGEVYSSVLSRLLAPHPEIDRKRVTILYRPLPAARAAAVVEADKRTADFRVNSATRPSARAMREVRAAHDTANEEARGAALVDFGMLITATVTDLDRAPDAKAAVENLAATARLTIRPAYGGQDSAFAAGLPVGVVLQSHMRLGESIRKAF